MNSHSQEKRPTKSGRWVSVLAGCVLLAVAAFLLLRPAPEAVIAEESRPPPPVMTVLVESRVIPQSLETLGTAQANETVTLSSKVTDRIESIHFSDGQDVKKGDLLFQLYSAEVEAQLMEATAMLKERERQLERVRSVGDSGAVSKSALDEELTRYDSAQAQVKLYESRTWDRRIVAPFDGRLGLRRVSPGELVSPGMELISISDLTPMKVDFTVPEQDVGRVRPGQEVAATSVAFPGEIFKGELVSVSPVIDPVSRAAQARAIIPNEDMRLRPGMLLKVMVTLGELDALLVPESALLPLGNKQFAFIVDDEGFAREREIQTGLRFDSLVVVTQGLAKGERVVTHGHRARDGQRVSLVESDTVFTVGTDDTDS